MELRSIMYILPRYFEKNSLFFLYFFCIFFNPCVSRLHGIKKILKIFILLYVALYIFYYCTLYILIFRYIQNNQAIRSFSGAWFSFYLFIYLVFSSIRYKYIPYSFSACSGLSWWLYSISILFWLQ